MKPSEINRLAEIMQTHGLTRVELGEGASRIVMERGAAALSAPAAVTASPDADSHAALATPVSTAPRAHGADVSVYTSPMVGVFYAASAPDAVPFVAQGQRVARGDVLGIIEAMKLMNEIAAEEAGEILDVLVKNGDVVEYGQPLFTIRRGGAQ